MTKALRQNYGVIADPERSEIGALSDRGERLKLASTQTHKPEHHEAALILNRMRSKRIFDVAVAGVLLFFFAPLYAVIYALVRLDGGPAFFGHPRVGANGEPFYCWKFRTMVVDADRVLAELLARDAKAAQEWKRDFKLRHDPRVTPIGRILRAISFDELPQLWNVIRGEMSLVGPRPIVPAEMARYGVKIFEYLACRPGVTGLWQVSGRNDLGYRERIELDTDYATHWSMTRDLQILLRTVGVVVKRNGAY